MSRFLRFASISLLVPAWALFALATDTRLAESVRARDIATTRSLLAQHVDVNAIQPDGMTALIWAAHNSDLPAAELLLKAGANVKIVSRYGVSALTEAATLGNSALVEALLKAGADPNTELPEGDTALMLASRTGDVPTVISPPRSWRTSGSQGFLAWRNRLDVRSR
jgi:ankyrin repeat protein